MEVLMATFIDVYKLVSDAITIALQADHPDSQPDENATDETIVSDLSTFDARIDELFAKFVVGIKEIESQGRNVPFESRRQCYAALTYLKQYQTVCQALQSRWSRESRSSQCVLIRHHYGEEAAELADRLLALGYTHYLRVVLHRFKELPETKLLEKYSLYNRDGVYFSEEELETLWDQFE